MPGVSLGVGQEIQVVQAGLDFLLEIQHALVVDFIIQHGMPGRALFHKLSKNAGFVGRQPFRGHFLEEQFAHRAPAPEGDDFLLVGLAGLGADLEWDLEA